MGVLDSGDMKAPAAAAAAVGNRAGGVDPSIPRFKCQECHRALVVVGVDSFADKLPAQATSGTLTPCPIRFPSLPYLRGKLGI